MKQLDYFTEEQLEAQERLQNEEPEPPEEVMSQAEYNRLTTGPRRFDAWLQKSEF